MELSTNMRTTRKILIILISIVIVSIIAALIFAYTSNRNIPVFSDIVEQVERVSVSDEQLASIVTDRVSQKLNSVSTEDAVTNSQSNNYKFDMNINGSVVDKTELKTEFKLNGNGSHSLINNQSSSELNLTTEINNKYLAIYPHINIKSISQDQTTNYVRVSNLDQFNSTPMGSLLNQWIDFSTNDIATASRSNDTQNVLNFNEEKKQNLINFLKSSTLQDSISRAPDRTINEIRLNCIKLTLDKDKFISFALQFAEIIEANYNSGQLNNIQDFDGILETCFGRRDNMLYKVILDIDFVDNVSIKYIVNATVDIHNFSENIKITRPDDSKNIMELLQF